MPTLGAVTADDLAMRGHARRLLRTGDEGGLVRVPPAQGTDLDARTGGGPVRPETGPTAVAASVTPVCGPTAAGWSAAGES